MEVLLFLVVAFVFIRLLRCCCTHLPSLPSAHERLSLTQQDLSSTTKRAPLSHIYAHTLAEVQDRHSRPLWQPQLSVPSSSFSVTAVNEHHITSPHHGQDRCESGDTGLREHWQYAPSRPH